MHNELPIIKISNPTPQVPYLQTVKLPPPPTPPHPHLPLAPQPHPSAAIIGQKELTVRLVQVLYHVRAMYHCQNVTVFRDDKDDLV